VFTRLFHGIKKAMVPDGFYQAFCKVFTRLLQSFRKAFTRLFFTFSEGVWNYFEMFLVGMHKLIQGF
jgi:hypothetical protein